MSLIKSQSVVTKTTTATLTEDDIKKLIASDMGVDPKNISLKFDISYEYSDYNNNQISNANFSRLQVKVTE